MADEPREVDESTATTNAPPPGDEELRRRLADRPGRRRWLKVAAAALAGIAVIGGLVLAGGDGEDDGPRYRSAPAEQGELAVTVNATGRLEARETVDVGTEISGRLLEVHVDHNDRVRSGQLLAEIDTAKLEAQRRQAEGRLRLALAELRAAEVKAELARGERARTQGLSERGLTTAQSQEASVAEAKQAEAAVETARARVAIAAATLDAAKDDLGRAEIVAPIDGIVLSRNVEPGQTLASAFQVPVLFQIARDLTQLRLIVQIDEADVARVREGQAATFTVEAHRGRAFRSTVESLRNVPKVEQGVVSYEAVLAVDNHEGLLRPGMTATATIVTERVGDALLVPNAALRFLPLDEAEREARREEEGSEPSDDEPRHRVYTLDEEGPVALAVSIGRSDGERTEIVGGELEPGTAVLVDVEEVEP